MFTMEVISNFKHSVKKTKDAQIKRKTKSKLKARKKSGSKREIIY